MDIWILFVIALAPSLAGALILWMQSNRADANDEKMAEMQDLLTKALNKIERIEANSIELRAAIRGLINAKGSAQQKLADKAGDDALKS